MKNADTFFSKQMKSLQIDWSRPIIFYGAGNNAPYIGNALKEIGVEPVCFADKDTKKHGTLCCGKPVLALIDAVKQYPNFLLFIATIESSWAKISEELLSSGLVAENQILNRQLGTYKSCQFLDGCIITNDSSSGANLSPCCMWSVETRPKFEVNFDDYDETLSKYFEFRSNVIDNLNSQNCQYCLGCNKIENRVGIDLFSRTLRRLHFGEHGVCNFECIYCPSKRGMHLNEQERIDYALFLHSLEKQKIIDENTHINVVIGEITLHPQCDEILSLVEKYNKTIFTNASIFNEKLASMMKSANTCLNVSLDAGTKETFRKVKRRNVFDKVCENLRKYANGNGKIELKYIILPDINDNTQDADGFLKICSEINASRVILSRNCDEGQLPEKSIIAGRYIYSQAQKLGLEIAYEVLDQDEIDSITLC